MVSDSRPNSAKIATTDGIEYKARVFMDIAVDTSDSSNRPSRFEVQNFARHGAGYSNWWYQERLNGNSGKQITTRHRQMEDPDSDLPKTKQCDWYVTVFINLVSPIAEEYRLQVAKSLGGQVKVFCDCSKSNPLIVSRRRKKDKRKCMNGNCGGLERFICSDVECGTKICEKCYNDCDEGHVIRNVPRSLGDKQMADNQSNNGGNDEEVADNEVQEFEYDIKPAADDNYDPSQDEEFDREDSESIANSLGTADVADGNSVGQRSDATDGDIELDGQEFVYDIESAADDDYDPSHDQELDREDSESTADRLGTAGISDGGSVGQRSDTIDGNIELNGQFVDESLVNRVTRTSAARRVLNLNRVQAENVDDEEEEDIFGNNDEMLNHIGNVDAALEGVTLGSAMNYLDDVNFQDPAEPSVPTTSTGDQLVEFHHRNEEQYNATSCFPMFVLFNQAAVLCTRHTRRITGTQAQQHFVQRMCSTIRGFAVPLLYFFATLFP